MLIIVDCGTTNMRCSLYRGEQLIDKVKRQAGVRNTAFEGTTDFLKSSLRASIRELLSRNGLCESDIRAVVSSGTLASDVGIYPIPHVPAPAGISESANGAHMAVLEEITSIPIFFIPGVKVLPDETVSDEAEKIALWDSMSGEECEIYGIMALMGLSGSFVISLPGSYNKTLEIDGDGRIVSMKTGMCGELIAAISEHTLLRHSLPQPVIQKILPEKLIQGFSFAREHGVSPAMIKARLVRFLGGWGETEAANFFVGAVLLDDVRMSARAVQDGQPLVLGGSDPLRSIFKILLGECGVTNLIEVPQELAAIAPNIGARLVYDRFKKHISIMIGV